MGGDGWTVGGKWSGEDRADLRKGGDGVEGHSFMLLKDIWTLVSRPVYNPESLKLA